MSTGSRFNWAHRQVGHLFAGRFKAAVIQEVPGVCEVARYAHLNPVRIQGLGLGKAEQRRERRCGSGLATNASIEVDLSWREGRLTEAFVRSLRGGSVVLRYGSVTRGLKLGEGQSHRWDGQ